MTVTDSVRFAEDFANAADVVVSQNQKAVYLVTVTNDMVNFNDSTSNRVVTSTRLTIADGYRASVAATVSPYDGYMNPRVEELTGNVMIATGAQLMNKTVLVGPFVLPYTLNTVSGGRDPVATFQPAQGSNSNISVYLQIVGLGLPSNVDNFQINNILLSGKGIQEGISFKVLASTANVNLNV